LYKKSHLRDTNYSTAGTLLKPFTGQNDAFKPFHYKWQQRFYLND